jgi:ribonuclease HI
MLEIYIDGASAGNPGPAGAGIYMKRGSAMWKESWPLPGMSNHEAEFHACLKALKRAEEEGFRIVSLRSDAKVLVEAVEKRHTKNKQFRPLLEEILHVMDTSFDHVFIKWIPSSRNGEADRLAKTAVQQSQKEYKH